MFGDSQLSIRGKALVLIISVAVFGGWDEAREYTQSTLFQTHFTGYRAEAARRRGGRRRPQGNNRRAGRAANRRVAARRGNRNNLANNNFVGNESLNAALALGGGFGLNGLALGANNLDVNQALLQRDLAIQGLLARDPRTGGLGFNPAFAGSGISGQNLGFQPLVVANGQVLGSGSSVAIDPNSQVGRAIQLMNAGQQLPTNAMVSATVGGTTQVSRPLAQ